MINILAILSLISASLCFLLGNFVYHSNKKRMLNKIFMLLCLSISYLAFTNFMVLQAEGLDVAYFWSKAGFFWPFSITFMVHFILVFTEKTLFLRNKLALFLIHIPALFFSFLELTTNLITDGMIKTNWGISYIAPENSLVYWASNIWLFTLGIFGLFFCVRYYMKETDLKKKQAKFVVIGISIPFSVYLFLELCSIFLQVTLPDLSVFSTTALSVFFGYAIWKYDLFVLNPITVAENIISTMPDSLVIVGTKGDVLAVNQSLITLLGYTEDEMIGKKFDLFFLEEQFARKTLESLFRKGKLEHYETKYKTKSNQEFDVNISASTVRDKAGQISGAIVIIRDITERNQIKKLLIKSENLVAIGQAATMVGHDLRNPLQAIENGIYLLTMELSKNQISKETKRTIDAINNSIEYADNIVNNLRSFTKTKKPMLQETDINATIEESLSLVNKPNMIELMIEKEELPRIKVDKEMMKRVFVNLATNGIQAMKKNGGVFKVSTKKNGDFVEVSFKDTGVGISKENLAKIFTPFFTTKAQGMGVGLAICKQLVELHGGKIEVESEEDTGSIFTVKLPYND